MICPHCRAKSPNQRWEGDQIKAAPLAGTFRMCLRCGGLSVHLNTDELRLPTQEERKSVIFTHEYQELLIPLRAWAIKSMQAEMKSKGK